MMKDKTMKKISIIAAIAVLAFSCTKENQIPVKQNNGHEVNLQEITLTVGQEGVETKTFFDKSNGHLTWTTTESPMAIFDGTGKQSFSHVSTEDAGLHATFSGTADVNEPDWIAVHPATNSSWENSKVYVTIPCYQTARSGGGMLVNMNTTAAKVTHTGADLDGFTMKNIGGLLKLTVAKAGIKTITVSSRGGQPLTGKAELSFDGDGNPVVTPVEYNYETFVTLVAPDLSTGLAAGDYFVSVFPAALTTGILIDMENVDGTEASVKATASATLSRAADLEFAGFDTGASWYTPEESTISINFQPNWPFNETITSSSADGASWAGPGEHVMTYTPDNSILFYLHCSNWATAKSSGNGMRFGQAAGDYLLFPAIPGKKLKKVVVKHSQNDNSNPAIITRGGAAVVDGGTAEGNATANEEYTWNLSGTAHNMQYRYQMTKAGLAFLGTLELTYVSKPSTTTVLDLVFWNGENYIVDGAINQPFTSNLPLSNTTIDSDFIFKRVSGNSYTFHIAGTNTRLAVHAQWRGLNLNTSGDYIKLPAIEGMKLTLVEAVLGGRAYENYVSTAYDPDIAATHGRHGNKIIYISTSSSSSDAIETISTGSASIVNPPEISQALSGTSANTSYYLVTGTSGVALRELKLTYSEATSASASASAPAQLLDGGSIVL